MRQMRFKTGVMGEGLDPIKTRYDELCWDVKYWTGVLEKMYLNYCDRFNRHELKPDERRAIKEKIIEVVSLLEVKITQKVILQKRT